MDEIWLVVTVVLAAAVFGFLGGMMALMRARELAAQFDRKVSGLWGLTPEQIFGGCGVVVVVGIAALAFLR